MKSSFDLKQHTSFISRIKHPKFYSRVLSALPFIFIAVFLGIPLVNILQLSLESSASTDGGLKNWTDQLQNEAVRASLVRTFTASCIIVALTLALAYPLAVILTTTRWKALRTFLIFAVIAQLFVSVVVSSFGWVILLSPNGPVEGVMNSIGLGSVQILYNAGAALVGMVQILLPFMLLPIWSSLRALDPDLLDAGRLLGAREFTLFMRVMLPLSVPGIFAGMAVVFAVSMSGYVTPLLLGGPVDGLWTSVLITNDVLAYNDKQSAAATSLVYLLVLALGLLLLAVVERRLAPFRVKD